MSRPGKALVYMLPLLVVSTVLVLGHPAMTQQSNPPSISTSDLQVPRAAEAPPVGSKPEPAAEEAPVAKASAPRRIPAIGTNRPTPESVVGTSHAPAPAAAEKPAASPRRGRRAEEAPAPRYRKVTVRMRVTAYCPCRKCCGQFSDGKTASGRRITHNGGKFVAADTSLLPFGTMLSIPGYNGGKPVPVEDRGGRIKGMRLDVFYYSHHQARQWGSQWLDVTVYVPVE
ncbi:MAG: 3D domain-containing protein [Phycisphaerae bacterium]